MSRGVKVFALAWMLVYLATGSGYAQQQSPANDTSLGTLARKLRAEKSKERPPTVVISNDNLGAVAKSDVSEASSSATAKSSPDTAASKPATPATPHNADYYHAEQHRLQDQLDTHKRELDVLQQKLGQNQMQYYPDPNKSLSQQYTRNDINKLTADIDAKKQQVAADEKALDDLREQLRHESGDPGWLR